MITFMDGGMLFELNKVYSDYGEYAVEHNKELIINRLDLLSTVKRVSVLSNKTTIGLW